MSYGNKATFDTLREVAFGSVTGSFAVLGSALTHDVRELVVVNTTDKDLYLSIDGTNACIRVGATSAQPISAMANRISDYPFIFPIGLQFYVKETEAGAPTKGSIAIECVYATIPI